MDAATIGIAFGALVAGAVIAWFVARRDTNALQERLSDSETTRANLQSERNAIDVKLGEAQVAEATARTRLGDALENIERIIKERDSAFSERNQARLELQEAEKQVALANERVAAAEKRMADWETQKAEMMQHTKAAVLEIGNTVSTKLLADHKQETEAAKKETAERVDKAAKAFGEQVESVVKSVATLNDQVGQTREMAQTVWKALSSPGDAGHSAEIGLENCLKQFGLERGRDFLMQYNISTGDDGGRLRPDSVVFLPFESALVVDSKASKFILEIASAEGTENEDGAYQALGRTMNNHLRSLASKDYKAAILAAYRQSGRKEALRRVISVMYLPDDASLEKVKRADAEFQMKAAREEIIVVGPTLLQALVAYARLEIDFGRQVENQEHIVDAVQQLLESIGVMVAHAQGVGRGIRSANESFLKLAGSVNSRLLPRARKLAQLGVRPPRGKALPRNLPAYQIHEFGDETVIDGEAEEVASFAITDQSAD